MAEQMHRIGLPMTTHVDLSASFDAWWRTLLTSGEFAFDVVVGARQSGKSSFLKSKAVDGGDVVYWSIFDAVRAHSVEEAWHEFFEVLGAAADAGADLAPDRVLDAFLGHRGDITVVIDNWDDAVRAPGGTVGDAYYEMLDELWGYCRQQTGSSRPKLGLVLVTSLPAASDLDWFSRQTQRPAFRRLSGAIARQMRSARFPFLTLDDSVRLLAANGYDDAVARHLAEQTGGWLWLLNRAVDARGDPRSVEEVVTALAQVEVPRMLSAALLPALAERPETVRRRAEPLGNLTRVLQDGRHPEEFGLPSDYEDASVLAPVLRLALLRTFVVVDTENVRVPFSRWADAHPDQLSMPVYDLLRPYMSAWVLGVAREAGAATHEIWLCGKSETLIDQIVDETLAKAQRIDVPRAMRGKGGADDQLMGMFLAQEATRYPRATFVLLSGDQDLPLLLDTLGFDGTRLAVHAPWELGKELRGQHEKFGALREQTLGMKKPPAVSDRAVQAARQKNHRDR